MVKEENDQVPMNFVEKYWALILFVVTALPPARFLMFW